MKINSKKGILFFVPNWEKPAELWLNRMIFNMEDSLTGIICPNKQYPLWGNKIPALSTSIKINYFTKTIKKIVSKRIFRKINDQYLLKKLNSSNVNAISIHYLTLAVTYLSVILKTQKPVFIHCHGYDVTWDLMESTNPQKKAHPDDYIENVKKLANKSFFVANSYNTINNLKKIGISEDRIYLCNYGIPVGKGKKEKHSGELVILYLGRLVDFKGPEQVIKAFELACKKGLKARLIIAGDGPLRITCELLKRSFAFGSKISILGEISWDQGQALFSEADIFTAHNRKGPLTNQEEAFGVSIVEAMAAGIPVVTGRNGGCIETVIHNETGILVEPDDIEAHAEAFLLLGTNSSIRDEMGKKGKARVRAYFSPELERSRLADIYGITNLRKQKTE
jgi:glycosyltransferase involved in cell wall biosynthesis